METIKLKNRQWQIDTNQTLGRAGGFGEVFVGFDENGERVAIKRLKLDSSKAAVRETYIGEELSKGCFKNIVPILDCGQDADSDRYFLVMPICSKNLWDEIEKRDRIPNDEIIKILLEILNGLEEVESVVHRDLKPQNILFHDGAWKIADFGIAKFTEDSTSLETLRSSLTPAYAAPEQWNLQRPTNATDIYSLGCIAHALKTGFPPFKANTSEDLREYHIKETPSLLELPLRAQGLIANMLRKPPEVRPSRKRCLEVLNDALKEEKKNSDTSSSLDKVVNAIAIEKAQQETKKQVELQQQNSRNAIFKEAALDLAQIKHRFFTTLHKKAKDVSGKQEANQFVLGSAIFVFDIEYRQDAYGGEVTKKGFTMRDDHYGICGGSGRQPRCDIIAFTKISLAQRINGIERGISANLVLYRPDDSSEYRWYEMSFFSMIRRDIRPVCYQETFSLENHRDIDLALSNVMHTFILAHEPVPIDGEDESSFVDYWMKNIADAAKGNLVRRSEIPFKR